VEITRVFGIEWSEYVIIAIVALIVIGPKELPAVLRTIGQWTTKIRRMAAEFQGQFQEALREAEMADLKKEVDGLNDAARGFTSQFDDPLNLKEATRWEAKPDAADPDTAKRDDVKADDGAKPADVTPQSPPVAPAPPPLHAGEGREGGDETFPVAAEHTAVAQPAAIDAVPAQHAPAAQSRLPEESSQRSEGGVHS